MRRFAVVLALALGLSACVGGGSRHVSYEVPKLNISVDNREFPDSRDEIAMIVQMYVDVRAAEDNGLSRDDIVAKLDGLHIDLEAYPFSRPSVVTHDGKPIWLAGLWEPFKHQIVVGYVSPLLRSALIHELDHVLFGAYHD